MTVTRCIALFVLALALALATAAVTLGLLANGSAYGAALPGPGILVDVDAYYPQISSAPAPQLACYVELRRLTIPTRMVKL